MAISHLHSTRLAPRISVTTWLPTTLSHPLRCLFRPLPQSLRPSTSASHICCPGGPRTASPPTTWALAMAPSRGVRPCPTPCWGLTLLQVKSGQKISRTMPPFTTSEISTSRMFLRQSSDFGPLVMEPRTTHPRVPFGTLKASTRKTCRTRRCTWPNLTMNRLRYQIPRSWYQPGPATCSGHIQGEGQSSGHSRPLLRNRLWPSIWTTRPIRSFGIKR